MVTSTRTGLVHTQTAISILKILEKLHPTAEVRSHEIERRQNSTVPNRSRTCKKPSFTYQDPVLWTFLPKKTGFTRTKLDMVHAMFNSVTNTVILIITCIIPNPHTHHWLFSSLTLHRTTKGKNHSMIIVQWNPYKKTKKQVKLKSLTHASKEFTT